VIVNVAANDTDAESGLNPASVNTDCDTCADPAHGSLVAGNGSFTYTPAANYNGPDSFVYEICDTGAMCATATVALTVSPVADPPQPADDSFSVSKNTAEMIDVAANDSDPDGDLVEGSANTTCPTCSLPDHGNLANQGNGIFTYTPDLDYVGADSFVYQICDQLDACATATATITVGTTNEPPVANNDSASTFEDTPVNIDVAANDTDADGNLDPASADNITNPAHGNLVNNFDGSFTYTPAANYVGSDSFTYEICDTDSECDTATVSITVRIARFYFYLPVTIKGDATSGK
jgi:hypothetical protein